MDERQLLENLMVFRDLERDIEQDPVAAYEKDKRTILDQLEGVKQDPYYKESLAGLDRPAKKGELRKKRLDNQQQVIRYERDAELQKTAAVYGAKHYRTRQILEFDPGNVTGYSGNWRGPAAGASGEPIGDNTQANWRPKCLSKTVEKINLVDNKISFDIVKKGLQRNLEFLQFLDA